MSESVPAKKITQETFDEVVQENIDEFELSKDEAIFDAYKQFSSQGVDMTDIDISGGVGRQDVLDAIAVLKTHGSLTAVEAAAAESIAANKVLDSIAILSKLCTDSHDLCKRNLVMMRSNGGLDAIHLLMFPTQNAAILAKSLTLLEQVSTNSGKKFLL
jgi:hypothetical protein